MTVKERISEFIEHEGVTRHNFITKVGIANGFFNTNNGVNSDNLEKIFSIYPDLNMDWVVTGRGQMVFKAPLKDEIPRPNFLVENLIFLTKDNAVRSFSIIEESLRFEKGFLKNVIARKTSANAIAVDQLANYFNISTLQLLNDDLSKGSDPKTENDAIAEGIIRAFIQLELKGFKQNLISEIKSILQDYLKSHQTENKPSDVGGSLFITKKNFGSKMKDGDFDDEAPF